MRSSLVLGLLLSLVAASTVACSSSEGGSPSSIPLAGGATKLVLKTDAPSSLGALPGFLFVTDKSYGRCTQTDEGQACSFDGSAFRVKY